MAGVKPITGKVSDVLKSPAKFDGKVVAISGKVSKFTARTSRSGNAYFLFKLEEGKDQLSVYGQGKLKDVPKDGATVVVTGKFEKERKVGDRTYKNEIDASARLDKSFGVKIKK